MADILALGMPDEYRLRPSPRRVAQAHLEGRWDTDRLGVRRQLWQNFGAVLVETEVIDCMPRRSCGPRCCCFKD